MESWWILVAISIFTFFFFFLISRSRRVSLSLPPGPSTFPVLGSLVWLRKSFSELEPILRRLHGELGPLVTLYIGPRPAVFVADRSLAHHALVHNGAVFAGRPPALPTSRVISSNQHNISAAAYGPTWRILRRNLTAEILHPSRVSAYGPARRWVLGVLADRLAARADTAVDAMEHFQYAMFCLLVLMCFGDKLDEPAIKDIETVQRRLLLSFGKYNILNFWPSLTKILLRGRWREFLRLRSDQEAVLVPLINSRNRDDKQPTVPCYVDTLLNLQLPAGEKGTRKLEVGEIVSLCSEFLNAGTDTTSTALQWIMANLVKHPEIQERVYAEVKAGAGAGAGVEVVSEQEVGKMRYLKAVVLEGLRRHPPGHFVLPHAVSEDVELGGYLIPKKASINFMVAEMGWDPEVWEDPMAFNPERFLHSEEEVLRNITKSSGETIMMMPFGAGRRICPGSDLALLHLQYFVGNLVGKFKWSEDPDHPVDLSEKQEFTVVMKHPLRARLSPRT